MNKKGFTLIELLAALVILSLILITSVPSTINILDRNKKQKYFSDAKKLISLAELYMRKNDITYPNDDKFIILGFEILNDGSLKNDPDGKEYSNENSYVAIKKVLSGDKYEYSFYSQLVNTSNHGIRLSSSSELESNNFKLIENNVPNKDCSVSEGVKKCPSISEKLFNGNKDIECIELSSPSKSDMYNAKAICPNGYVDQGNKCLKYRDADYTISCPSGTETNEYDEYCYSDYARSIEGQRETLSIADDVVTGNMYNDGLSWCENICNKDATKKNCVYSTPPRQPGLIYVGHTYICTYAQMCSNGTYEFNQNCYNKREEKIRVYYCNKGEKLTKDNKCEMTADYKYECDRSDILYGKKCLILNSGDRYEIDDEEIEELENEDENNEEE